MTFRFILTSSAAPARLRAALCIASVAAFTACDSSGPRTGKLSLTVGGLPSATTAKVTLKGPNGFTRALTGTEVVASLKPGNYSIIAESVRNGLTRYSPLADSQAVTITKSDVPVDASVAYTRLERGVDRDAFRRPRRNRRGGSYHRTTGIQPDDLGDVDLRRHRARVLLHRRSRDRRKRAALRGQPALAASAVAGGAEHHEHLDQLRADHGQPELRRHRLPQGVSGDISVAGPVASYVVGGSSDLIGVRAGQYTVNVKHVQSGTTLYIPNFSAQTISLQAGATSVVTVNYTSSDGPLNFTVDGVTLTQVVQTYAGTVPLIAGRDGFIRVFARANQPNTQAVKVRVRMYAGETLLNTMMLQKSAGVPLVPDQASMEGSWNGIVVGQFIVPGLRIVADVDPANEVVEASESDNAFPASGDPLAVTVREVAPLRITFVPIIQRFNKALVGNVSDANKDQFLVDARRMLPLLDIDAQVHAPYTTADSLELTSNDGNSEWLRVLSETNALRIAESSLRHYYGVVKVSYNSGVAGYGYVPGRAAVGWDYLPSGRNVAAHELGHNFSRAHAPCGGVGGPDPDFPYAGGLIGQFGYDLSTSTLRLPSSSDLMGYCGNPWISDYNFVGAMDWRASNPTPGVAVTSSNVVQAAPPQPSLLVWGRVERGQLVLEPTFSLVARPTVPTEPGPYRVEGIARNGRTLFSYSFSGERPADSEDATARHFAFAIPMDETTQEQLASIRLTGTGSPAAVMNASIGPGGVAAAINTVDATAGPSGAVNVRWDTQIGRMALIRERATGQVLSFARGGRASIRARSADLEVIVSDGVKSAGRAVRVSPR